MTQVSGVDIYKKVPANYNAVKIQINNPTTSIPEGFKPMEGDNGIYNAVNIEVNKPTVDVKKNSSIYNYPENNEIIPFEHVIMPNLELPRPTYTPMYQTFINNKTLVSAEIELEMPEKVTLKNDAEGVKNTEIKAEDKKTSQIADKTTYTKKYVSVPEPNFVEIAEAKNIQDIKEPAIQPLSFKGNTNKVEIVPPEEILPEVDVAKVISNLSNDDFDVQALQMEEIARISMEDSEKAIPYIVTEIFTELINIVEKDTTELTPPSEKQIDIRKKIIINEIVKEQATADGQDIEKIGLPYQLSEGDIKLATTLTDLEQAERNKEYSLYTMAILSKVYADNVEKQTGNIVPLTELPGVSSLVNTLRHSDNSGVKIAAIDALRYIHRPEYNDEIKSVLALAAQDKDPYAARNAAITLVALEEMEHNSKKNVTIEK